MQTEILVAFHSTSSAILAENLFLAQNLTVLVMPLPSTLKAGCGICLRLQQQQLPIAEQILLNNGITNYSLYIRQVNNGISSYQSYQSNSSAL